jgi:protein-L-isoaspartate(D-aspartate) O-methyltransferase
VGDAVSLGLRRDLVVHLRRHGHLTDERVAAAFLSVPREAFLPDHAERAGLPAVYRDEAIVTRRDAAGTPLSSSSQPAIMARMLEMLDVREGHRVLEVGAGTGYNAALLADLAGATGTVTTVELDRDVAGSARQGLLATGSPATVVLGDGRAGVPEAAPVDRIVVTASTESIPRTWYDQLVPGGLLVVPVRLSSVLFAVQAVVAFRKRAGGFESVVVTAGGFMALRGFGDHHAGTAAIVVPDAAGDVGEAGEEQPLVELSGPALAALGPAERQRLVVAALGFARHRGLDLAGASSWSLGAYAALGLPQERLVECTRPAWTAAGEHAMGVVDAVDGSIAFMIGAGGEARVEAHGGRGAEHALLNVVDRWQAAGRPGVDRLAIRVRFGSERPQAWRSLRRGDQWLALDWLPPPSAPPGPAGRAP